MNQALTVHNALLSSPDGFVVSYPESWFQFQRYPWNLEDPSKIPVGRHHRRHVEERLAKGVPSRDEASPVKGTFSSGLHPHVHSYYHLLTDILPHLMRYPTIPILVGDDFPPPFQDLLRTMGFVVELLPTGVWEIEQLLIPSFDFPNWNKEKVEMVQHLFERYVPRKEDGDRKERIYISRARARRRHFANEEELMPIFENHGFQRYYLEDLKIEEQIELFRRAEQIVAPHGAGLMNLIHAPATCRSLEVRPILTSGDFCFTHLAECGWPYHEAIVSPQTGRFTLPSGTLIEVLERWERDDN